MVAVPVPELKSNKTASAVPGTLAPPAPPLVALQLVVVVPSQVPVPPSTAPLLGVVSQYVNPVTCSSPGVPLAHRVRLALYVASYCLVRFGVESLRIDEAHHILGLRLNQVTAIVVGLSAAWMVRARRVHGD